MEEPYSFEFAPEIEAQLVSICWHDPHRIPIALKELDPGIHITQPHLRHILEALAIAYSELGVLDFACIVQILRELGQLAECGGLLGLNSVYVLAEHGYRDQVFFDHYLTMLKEYALHRKNLNRGPVNRFTDLKGTFYANKAKRFASDPDFVGEARGLGRPYSAQAWTALDGQSVNFRLTRKS